MSLFIPKFNAIFLHIPKCAGQSIEKPWDTNTIIVITKLTTYQTT